MRPIDADALEEVVQTNLRENPHKNGRARAFHNTEYIHFLDVIRRMPTIPLPPNDPLTLEELREMDGEPVWISYFAGGPNVCMLVDAKHDVCRDAHGGFAVFENLGRTWIAYRRKSKAPANAE